MSDELESMSKVKRKGENMSNGLQSARKVDNGENNVRWLRDHVHSVIIRRKRSICRREKTYQPKNSY